MERDIKRERERERERERVRKIEKIKMERVGNSESDTQREKKSERDD